MVKITFTSHDGIRTETRAEPGVTVMEVATANNIQGILGDCGGNLSCGTCHCYVPESWASRLPPPAALELEMLDGVLTPRAQSRLSCQLRVTPELDGIELELPEAQF